jgi:phosphoribosylformylglycinamidine synthase
MLILRGSPALSPFRLQKLAQDLAADGLRVNGIGAEFVHFAALEWRPIRRTAPRPRTTPDVRPHPRRHRHARAHPHRRAAPGTISPWSSKATDIAHLCGLEPVRRIERVTAFHLDLGGNVPTAEQRRALAARLHDRMTQAVFDQLEACAALFRREEPRPLASVPVLAQGRAALVAANRALGLALADDEIDYLVNAFTALAPRPERHRADDVRAGQLGALPPQDLQRHLGNRRRRRATARCSR